MFCFIFLSYRIELLDSSLLLFLFDPFKFSSLFDSGLDIAKAVAGGTFSLLGLSNLKEIRKIVNQVLLLKLKVKNRNSKLF